MEPGATGAEVALIGVLGLLAGAVVSGLVQFLLAASARRAAVRERRVERKRATYEAHLRAVASIPLNVRLGVIGADESAVTDQMSARIIELRVALHLDASDEVKVEVNALVDALSACRDEFANASASPPEGTNAFELFDDTFERIVWPAIGRCSTAMTRELRSR